MATFNKCVTLGDVYNTLSNLEAEVCLDGGTVHLVAIDKRGDRHPAYLDVDGLSIDDGYLFCRGTQKLGSWKIDRHY